MNYTIEPDGTIILMKNSREAELLYRAVQSKSLQLRKDPLSKETSDQYLGISVVLKEAIVESNQAIRKLTMDNLKKTAALRVNGVTQVKKAGFWSRVIDFFDAPFCTHDYEWAHTRSGVNFTIDGMIFSKMLYPAEVYGTVTTPDGELQVTWNSRGRCFSKTIKDVHCYDLIRQNERERQSNLMIGFSFILLIVFFSVLFLHL